VDQYSSPNKMNKMASGTSLSKFLWLDDDDGDYGNDYPITVAQVCTLFFSKYLYTKISLILPKSSSVQAITDIISQSNSLKYIMHVCWHYLLGGSFKDTFCIGTIQHWMVECLMNAELERIWKKWSWHSVVLSWHLPGGLRKITKTCQDNWCPGRDSNRAPPEYGSRALTLYQPVQ
jgi:hypothetical protein